MINYTDEKYLGINLKDCQFIGKGTQGSVYLLPDKKRVIKVYNSVKSCKGETDILLRVQHNPHFAKIYSYSDKCMIREYIGGICIKEYIKKYGFSKNLAINIVKLVESFKADGFKRLDIRFAHIFVQSDETIRVIDPRKVFEKNISYPRSMFQSLQKLGFFSEFMKIVKQEYPMLYEEWTMKYK